MSKAVNIAIAILFSAVLVGPAVVWGCEKAGIELPSWASAQDATYLSGNSVEADAWSAASLEGFASGRFQDELANEVANRIPFKASAMLGNAAGQRSLIALANAPFGYEAYPTFYSSDRLAIPAYNAVAYLPYKRSEEMLEQVEAFGRNLAQLAQAHPDKRFVVCLVQGYQEPAANPAYRLVANPALPGEYAEVLQQATRTASNVLASSQAYDTLEDYYANFFHTDHHWNHHGVERAYNDIAAWLGLPAFEEAGEVGFGDYRYSGAIARWGLDLVEEEVSGTAYGFPGLSVVAPDGTQGPYNHDVFFDRSDPGVRYAFYDSYYGDSLGASQLRGLGERTLLVVANSFGSALTPYLAEHYQATDQSFAIHPSGYDPQSRLEAQLLEGGFDDVVIVANPTDLANFQAACPDYLDILAS